ncbi:hypothetical protein SAMN04487917_106251 [Arthrobacter sp. yr096]|uniref:hypothetical protein n=1 Tax=unclassified Arthrobacter TaxID=235627 RepID=UPI0008978C79|nr:MULTISPECIES: hypothetical protein [unclassified Arthrobacter]SDX31901.1 hypothetical protein SAMN04487912_11065 [Arthrobacter sp. cf158]SEJ51002.1 hypothetical protein SAMN04487917_106251 [Arthrobacter sp. yr096]
MDSIKSQISAIDPLANQPTEVNSEEALARMLTGPRVFSDNNPTATVVSLEDRRRRKARIAGGLLLGAAAVTAGVLVAANFGPLTTAPAPAVSVNSSEATPTPSASVSPTATPSVTPTPSSTPEATPTTAPTQAPAATVPAAATTAPVVPPVPTSQTFTFPDGHLSFTYPVGWSVRAEQGPFDPPGTAEASRIVTVFDGAGAEVARIFNGNYADGTGGLVDRTILDRALVPGVRDNSGGSVEFGFSSNQAQYIPYEGPAYEGMPSPRTGPADGPPTYIMDVRLSSELNAGISSSGTNQVRVPNGIMSAYAVFDPAKQPTFATPGAAKAWMGSTQYAQLKAMFLSLSYK